MKIALAALAAILITGSALQTSYADTSQTAAPVHVNIDNYAYKAPTITIATGTTVIFKNLDDDPHTVTSNDGLFDSKGLAQGDTWTYRFTTPGTYHYHCTVHPMMQGTVIVKESGS